MHDHLATFTGHGERGLTFQIEMLLPTDLDAALQPVFRTRKCRVRVALFPDAGAVFEPRVLRERIVDGQDRGFFRDFRGRGAGGFARGQMAVSGDKKHSLPLIMNSAGGQQRFIMRGGGDVDVADVIRRPRQCHAGDCAHRRKVQRSDRPARHGRQAEGEMQAVRRRRQIVYVARLPGDMECGTVMRVGLMNGHG
ncbi:hypothetical protein PARPLA_02020 [Rhodobacteraceae bacterium THAF1]|nr:hypothetical protein PARPLA_02020 [Rhodobacteraceae bacterium THAF1]